MDFKYKHNIFPQSMPVDRVLTAKAMLANRACDGLIVFTAPFSLVELTASDSGEMSVTLVTNCRSA